MMLNGYDILCVYLIHHFDMYEILVTKDIVSFPPSTLISFRIYENKKYVSGFAQALNVDNFSPAKSDILKFLEKFFFNDKNKENLRIKLTAPSEFSIAGSKRYLVFFSQQDEIIFKLLTEDQ